jgi:cell division protein FtsI (penicillin-binding protein 3)
MALSYKRYRNGGIDYEKIRFLIVFIIIASVTGILIYRLFNLQVLKHNKYYAIAKEQHSGGITMQSQRGEILTRDRDNVTFSKLATNTTLDLLYVDPSVVSDPDFIAQVLAPYVMTKKDYDLCLEEKRYCPLGISLLKKPLDEELASADVIDQEVIDRPEIIIDDEPMSFEASIKEIESIIRARIAREEVDYTVLRRNVDEDTLRKVFNLHFSGIFVDYEEGVVFANPMLVPEEEKDSVARVLSIVLEAPLNQLTGKLSRRKIRYTPLKQKLDPDGSAEIREIIAEEQRLAKIDSKYVNKMKGVVLTPESWRYYPNGSVGSQLIGFHSQELGGQYGLEEAYNRELQGTPGEIMAENDPFNRPITFGDHEVSEPINGESYIVTISLPVQKKIEEILAEAVDRYKADKGQVIVMDPFTGKIVAMANYPTFNPNEYSRVYEIRELEKNEYIQPTLPTYVYDEDGTLREALEEELDDRKITKYIYKNKVGPSAYRNHAVQSIYEPGSVYKPVTMAIALDRELVKPTEIMCDETGTYEVDEFTIYNAEKDAHGCITMTEVLEKSSNIGMAYVAEKLGKPLFYSYIKDFGFGEYTDVELPDEQPGTVVPWKQWSEAKLITTSFGQGIAATPLQVASSWGALANGGLLMQPHIIDAKIDSEGNEIKVEPKVLKRVIGTETAAQITSMLVSTVENGFARTAMLDKNYVSGKTGTSQIANTKGVGYEKGEGSFITSFAGYFPTHRPRFVILVKLDRPRVGENTYGSTTAGPTFKLIAEFLAHYYNVPPDRQGFVGAEF